MEKLRNKIIVVMKSQNWDIEIHPRPKIMSGSENFYDPNTNTIQLEKKAGIETLTHELCHSLQPTPQKYIKKSEDLRAYLSQEVERQAYKIGKFFKELALTGQPSWKLLDKKPSRKEKLLVNRELLA